MRKICLLLPFLLASCNPQIKIISRYENVLYNISKENGELTVVYDYIEENGVVKYNNEYKTMNYTYARYLTMDNSLSNVFFIRKNAPDLLVIYYH